MSCPDWRALGARREADPGDVPGWQAALEHLDGCEDCRDEALAADPTLLFRRLPVLEADAGEMAAMQRAVASMRRSEAIEQARRAAPGWWLRAAALAVVLLGAALLSGGGMPPSGLSPSVELGQQPLAVVASPQSASPMAIEAETGAAGIGAAGIGAASTLPLVEMIDPAYGEIIQVVDQDISVVVVLPQNRDV